MRKSQSEIRAHPMHTRLNEAEVNQLNALIDAANTDGGRVTASEVLRWNLQPLNRIPAIRSELIQLRRELNAIGVNINQIAKANNAGFFAADDIVDLQKLLQKSEKQFTEVMRRLEEM